MTQIICLISKVLRASRFQSSKHFFAIQPNGWKKKRNNIPKNKTKKKLEFKKIISTRVKLICRVMAVGHLNPLKRKRTLIGHCIVFFLDNFSFFLCHSCFYCWHVQEMWTLPESLAVQIILSSFNRKQVRPIPTCLLSLVNYRKWFLLNPTPTSMEAKIFRSTKNDFLFQCIKFFVMFLLFRLVFLIYFFLVKSVLYFVLILKMLIWFLVFLYIIFSFEKIYKFSFLQKVL